MLEFINSTLNNLIITRIYDIVAALIISIPIGVIQYKMHWNMQPILWNLLDKGFKPQLIKLNNQKKNEQTLFFRGLFVVCIFIALTAILLIGLNIAEHIALIGSQIDTITLSLCLVTIYPFLLNRYVQKEYKEQKKLSATLLNIISASTMRAVNTADESAINRYIISMSVMSFTRYFIAPILFYLIGGIALLLIGTIFLWLAARIGSGVLTGAYSYAITIFEELLAVLPNFFATTLLIMATLLTPKTKFTAALHALTIKHSGHLLPGAHPLAIVAHCINISIGGKMKSSYGYMIERPWHGPKDAKAKVESAQTFHAQYLIAIAHILALFGLLILQ